MRYNGNKYQIFQPSDIQICSRCFSEYIPKQNTFNHICLQLISKKACFTHVDKNWSMNVCPNCMNDFLDFMFKNKGDKSNEN